MRATTEEKRNSDIERDNSNTNVYFYMKIFLFF